MNITEQILSKLEKERKLADSVAEDVLREKAVALRQLAEEKIRAQSANNLVEQIENERYEALATVEAMRKLMSDFGEYPPVCKVLSTQPSSHLRALKLEWQEEAWKAGFVASRPRAASEDESEDRAWLNHAWVNSATRAALLGETEAGA